jgi:hypothetical protein
MGSQSAAAQGFVDCKASGQWVWLAAPHALLDGDTPWHCPYVVYPLHGPTIVPHAYLGRRCGRSTPGAFFTATSDAQTSLWLSWTAAGR